MALIDQLAPLTGRAQSALIPDSALSGMVSSPTFSSPLQALGVILGQQQGQPDQQAGAPIGIGNVPPINMGTTNNVPTFAPMPPIGQDISQVLDLLRQAGVFNPPPEAPRPGLLQSIIQALPQAAAVGLSPQPGEALQGLLNQRQALAERERQTKEQEFRRQQDITGNVILGTVAERRRQEQEREKLVYGSERAFGLEEFRQGLEGQRDLAKRADAQFKVIGDTALKLGDAGVPAQLTQPLAEAIRGLRVWTPELQQAFDQYVPAKARADLAKTESETAKNRAEAQLAPIRGRELNAQIGRIGVLNRKDLEEMNPASKKKTDEVFAFSIREATRNLFQNKPHATREDVLNAVNLGRRAAIERLGGDQLSYQRFLDNINSDPTGFGAYVNRMRMQGYNDLEILNSNRGNQ